MFKKFSAILPAIILLLAPAIASAHVIVTPSQVGVGQELTFNVSVPNERDKAVTSLKLLLPSGISEVVPTEKNGWTIQTTQTATKDPEVNSISWTDGSIPVGQREDFSFSAQMPAAATNLDWKAYQTYADGTVVHWDQTPNGKGDDSIGNAGPFSVTKVVNDLTPSTAKTTAGSDTLVLIVSLLALILSVVALLRKP